MHLSPKFVAGNLESSEDNDVKSHYSSGSSRGSSDDVGESQKNLDKNRDSNAQYNGFLKMKEKGILGIEVWNKHLFSVIGHDFIKNPGGHGKEEYSLLGCKVVDFDHVTGKSNTMCVFLAGLSSQKLVLQAENPMERQQWISTLVSASQNDKVASANLLESLIDAAVGSDGKGIILSLNERCVKLFGYSVKEELLGKNIKILMEDSLGKIHDGFIQEYNETKIKYLLGQVRRVIAKRKDDSLFKIDLSLGEANQGDIKFLAIFRPVTIVIPVPDVEAVSELSSVTDAEILRTSLVEELELDIEAIRGKMSAGLGVMKTKLKLMKEGDENRKAEVNRLYSTLKSVKDEAKRLREEISLFKRQGTISIHDLLRSVEGRRAFLEFCCDLKCDESLLFWLDAEAYRRSNPDSYKEKAHDIWKKYLAPDAIKQVNTTEDVLKTIGSQLQLETPTIELFVLLQKEMIFSLADNAFKKFCLSGIGKAVIGNFEYNAF